MLDINVVKTAAADQKKLLPREIMAHRVSAEAHRHRNMLLGGVSTVLTTLVGTAVFTGLVSQFGLDGKGTTAINPFKGTGMIWVYGLVLLLSVMAPVITALHSFMHNAEDAATHQASVTGYSGVLSGLTLFLAKYGGGDTPPEKIDEALNEYDKIMKEHNSVLGKSLTLTKKAYRAADKVMSATPSGPEKPWWKVW
ncbi:MAG: hypothetical protein LAP86_34100 [Acidobacteriia bacterium]|nr:hypothetical protein [Terriglobia bacterium]